jgi:Uma2 family endonuclease
MAETPVHRDNIIALLDVLRARFASDPMVYVSANMLIYYVPGRKRRHVSPDVFLVRGIPNRDRDSYLVWEEGRGPDIVFEFTSESTRDDDLDEKFELYQDELRVLEYFLFDPREEYLTPSLQGFKLREGRYESIEPIAGRLPSQVLGLHLQRVGNLLRLVDPVTGETLLTSREALSLAQAALKQAEAEKCRADEDRLKMVTALHETTAALMAAKAERERIERELEELRCKVASQG